VKEIASKFASADFQNFCRLATKKSAESADFFSLEGTLLADLALCLMSTIPVFFMKWQFI